MTEDTEMNEKSSLPGGGGGESQKLPKETDYDTDTLAQARAPSIRAQS